MSFTHNKLLYNFNDSLHVCDNGWIIVPVLWWTLFGTLSYIQCFGSWFYTRLKMTGNRYTLTCISIARQRVRNEYSGNNRRISVSMQRLHKHVHTCAVTSCNNGGSCVFYVAGAMQQYGNRIFCAWSVPRVYRGQPRSFAVSRKMTLKAVQ
jgi:hypothetical protein